MLKKVVTSFLAGVAFETGVKWTRSGGPERLRDRIRKVRRKASDARTNGEAKAQTFERAFEEVLKHANFYNKERAFNFYNLLAQHAPIMAVDPEWSALWISWALMEGSVKNTDLEAAKVAQWDQETYDDLSHGLMNAVFWDGQEAS